LTLVGFNRLLKLTRDFPPQRFGRDHDRVGSKYRLHLRDNDEDEDEDEDED
jgi:hypothetical protein